MIRYVLQRILLLIPIVLGVSFIVFSILELTPSDPGRLILGQNAEQKDVDELNRRLGYDRPFFIRYLTYIKDAVTKFEFGRSYVTQRPVVNEIKAMFPTTLKLALLGVMTASLIGIPLGVMAAVKQYSAGDNIASVLAMLIAAVPEFWLGMMFILVFGLFLGWLPTFGATSWRHFILPVFTMAIPSAAKILRMTKSTMLETIRQDYIRTARAKGQKERIVIFRHALKNAVLPIINMVGTQFGLLLGGSVLIESVFSLPGLGTLVVNAIRRKDIPQVLATVIFIASLFCFILLMVDLLFAFMDPRIKAKYIRIKNRRIQE